MASVHARRCTAEIDGDFVVFLIGMRINRLWKVRNKAIGSSGDVGIWHETYKVSAGAYECIYNNMPVQGLVAAGRHVPVGAGRERTAERIGAE